LIEDTNFTHAHTLKPEEALSRLESTKSGLTSEEVQRRQTIFPLNQLVGREPPTKLQIFINQFKDILIIILIIAALISIFVQREFTDAMMIFVILLLNAYFGMRQEFKADRAIQALQNMTAQKCEVIRDSEVEEIETKFLVPGDIIRVGAGIIIPADARLLEAVNLKTIEASLTGESTEVRKFTYGTHELDSSIGDRNNMLYKGTHVSSGRGLALVTETGMNTEFGKIASLVSDLEIQQTPIQENLDHLGKQLGYITIAISIVVIIIGILAGGEFGDMILLGVSLSVAAIPEGLPIVVTLAMALGVQRMAKRNAIVRKLPSVEALGAASVICTDKTGTLTVNKMTVRKIAVFHENKGFIEQNPAELSQDDINDELEHLFLSGVLCNNAALKEKDDETLEIGDPTEVALLRAANTVGCNVNEINSNYILRDELPFDSERKRMTTVHEKGGEFVSYTKGAPDILIEMCDSYLDGNVIKKITPEIKKIILDKLDNMADQALRILAFAMKPMDKDIPVWNILEMEQDLVFVGLMGLIDPPKDEVFDAVLKCKTAGVKTIMVTGDHKRTAAAIGRELNILNDPSEVITGKELDVISDEELSGIVDNYSIYARINPAHKLRIIQAFQSNNKIVAMTGDGINDAPALKAADIGIAMGITGTDVTKETSDIVLADDNFATIVSAIEEGRAVYQSMGKFLKYMLSSNSAEILVITIAIVLGLPPPFVPIQILWINLVTDGLPALALGVDPAEPGQMDKPPRSPDEHILSRKMIFFILRIGIYMTILSLGTYVKIMDFDFNSWDRSASTYVYASTMTFAVLSFIQLFNSFGTRSEFHSLLGKEFFANKALLWATFISGFALFTVIQGDQWMSFITGNNVQILSGLFKVTPLGWLDWLIIISLSSSVIFFEELFKLIDRRRLAKRLDTIN
jgi:Ca2+-transporting ATPase